jgi:hypothetical protein
MRTFLLAALPSSMECGHPHNFWEGVSLCTNADEKNDLFLSKMTCFSSGQRKERKNLNLPLKKNYPQILGSLIRRRI